MKLILIPEHKKIIGVCKARDFRDGSVGRELKSLSSGTTPRKNATVSEQQPRSMAGGQHNNHQDFFTSMGVDYLG